VRGGASRHRWQFLNWDDVTLPRQVLQPAAASEGRVGYSYPAVLSVAWRTSGGQPWLAPRARGSRRLPIGLSDTAPGQPVCGLGRRRSAFQRAQVFRRGLGSSTRGRWIRCEIVSLIRAVPVPGVVLAARTGGDVDCWMGLLVPGSVIGDDERDPIYGTENADRVLKTPWNRGGLLHG
jgi:hypothetical protein